jgi:hypothetical protein
MNGFLRRQCLLRTPHPRSVGPDVVAGKYFGMNETCFIARATVGCFGAIGSRTAINPCWLSTNEFQYHPKSFDWVCGSCRKLRRVSAAVATTREGHHLPI